VKVLLTGANGFLAKAIEPRLRAAGYEVLTTDQRGDVDFLGDLAEHPFTQSLPDVDSVVHCAAVQYVSADIPLIRRERFFERNNVVATTNLVSRYSGTVDFFLNIGTSMMYDQTGLSEYSTNSPMRGQGVYSRSKFSAYQRVSRMDNPTATMIPAIIGGEGREGLFRNFVSTMTKYNVALCPGPGTHLTHMVHVLDAAELAVLILGKKLPGKFNAAGPDPLSINNWVDIIQQELSLKSVRRLHVPFKPIEFGGWASGYRAIAREQVLMLNKDHVLSTVDSLAIGWAPKFTNERIVRDIARYIAGSPAHTLSAA